MITQYKSSLQLKKANGWGGKPYGKLYNNNLTETKTAINKTEGQSFAKGENSGSAEENIKTTKGGIIINDN